MLIGEFTTKLGEKNRIALPKKFRKELGEHVVVTRGYEGCVTIVNKKQLERLMNVFNDKPFTLGPARDTRRFLIGGASEIDLDKQGRFVLPQNLVSYAKIQREIIFIGLVDWVEAWDSHVWEKKLQEIQLKAPKIAEQLENIYKNS